MGNLVHSQESDDSTAVEHELEEIVVVGSRIPRKGEFAPPNVQVLGSNYLEKTGLTSIGDILRQLSASGSPLNTQFNLSGNTGFPPDGGGVAAGETHVDLRYLGSKRVLFLVDGVRWINGSSASGVGSSVDLNTIPLALVERIDVFKDGASAVYGSDALSGVVNVVTKSTQDGMEAVLQTGSYKDGGGTWSLSLADGIQLQEWSVVGGLTYVNQDGINSSSREQSRYPLPDTGNLHGSTFTPQGRIVFTDPNTDTFVNCALDEGTVQPLYDPDDPCGATDTYHNWSNSDRFNYGTYNLLLTPSERVGAFARFERKLTPNTTTVLKAVINRRESMNRAAPEPIWVGEFAQSGSLMDSITIHSTNPFNHFGFDIGPEGTLITRRPIESGPRAFTQEVDTAYFSGQLFGLSKLLDHSWEWDVNVVVSRNVASQTKHGAHNALNLKLALGPISECAAPCVPFNMLGGAGSISDEMLDWVGFVQRDSSKQSQFIASANFFSRVFELPAGSIGIATGLEHRSLSGSFSPDPVVAAGHTAGIPAQPIDGDYQVNELYVETEVPIFVSLNGKVAVRVFDYSTFDLDYVAQSSLQWFPRESFSLTSTLTSGFRAPSIGELFGGQTRYDAVIADPCSSLDDTTVMQVVTTCIREGVPADGSYVQLSSQISLLTGGNPDLFPETSDGITLSLDYVPEWLDDVIVRFMAYRFEIDSTITAHDAQTVLESCYVENIVGFCRFIERRANGTIEAFTNTLFNIGTLRTSGFDFELNYRRRLKALGELALSFNTTHVESYTEISRDALGIEISRRELVGRTESDSGIPRLKYIASASLTSGPWNMIWQARYIDQLEERCSNFLDGTDDSLTSLGLCSEPNYEDNTKSQNSLDSVVYQSIVINFEQPVGDRRLGLILGIDNVLGTDSPRSYSATLNGYDPSTHEIPESRYVYFKALLRNL